MKKIKIASCFVLTMSLLWFSGCSSGHESSQSLSSLKALESKSKTVTCNEQLLQDSGLFVLSTNAIECSEWAAFGDSLCAQRAELAGLEDIRLEFYMDLSRTGSKCGCKCDRELEDLHLTPCSRELQHDLGSLEEWADSIFYQNAILLEQSESCDQNHQTQCEAIDELTNLNLTLGVIEYHGENWCACQCSSEACQFDRHPMVATQYHAFGNGNDIPYRIHTGAQLFSMSRNVGALDKNYELCRDIDLSDFYGSTNDSSYFSIGSETYPFTGNFEGNNHSIDHFTYDQNGQYYSYPGSVLALDMPGEVLRNSIRNLGLFGRSRDATIQNLILNNVSIGIGYSGEYTGGLLGYGENSIVRHVTVSGHVNSASYGTGGVIGGLVGDIDHVISNVDVNGGLEEVGGVVGHLYEGSINHAISTGKVSGGDGVGGIAGICRHIINESHSTGDVFGGNHNVGGLVGLGGLISNSYAIGNVFGKEFVGGLVGSIEIGGEIRRSYATGKVYGTTQVGGLAGNVPDIVESYATGDVFGQDIVGGLAGNAGTLIRKSYATGNVSGQDYVGGLAGGVNDRIIESYATGNVSGRDNIGGLVAWAGYALIKDSYATGNVSGRDTVGGLVGHNVYSSMSIEASFASQSSINGESNVGAIIGRAVNIPTITNTHYWSGVQCTIAPCIASNGEIDHNFQSDFYNPVNAPLNIWDFTNVWRIDVGNGYPYLDL
ncbi:MAG: hypothetical protein KDD48_05235 [Bdellovibrionales bacterium]|nr:hypothetical protein [Bdellovibrionales bacterium]